MKKFFLIAATFMLFTVSSYAQRYAIIDTKYIRYNLL